MGCEYHTLLDFDQIKTNEISNFKVNEGNKNRS